MHRANRDTTIVWRSSPNLGELRPPPQLATSTQRQNVDCTEVEAGREEEAAVRAGSRLARRGLPRRLFSVSFLIVPNTVLSFTHILRVPTYLPYLWELKKFALETANAWGLSSSILFSTTFLEPQLPLAYRCGLRFRNSFVFTTRPPRAAAPSCKSCPSRPQGRRHI